MAVEQRDLHHVEGAHGSEHEVHIGRPEEAERAAAEVRRVGVRRRLVRVTGTGRARVRVRVRVGVRVRVRVRVGVRVS